VAVLFLNTGAAEQAAKAPRTSLGREALRFSSIYVFLAFINLRAKVWLTPSWFDGILDSHHSQLVAYQYVNREQSRLLQFYFPEALHRAFGWSVPHSYVVQRWLFVFLAFVAFHLYLRKWFDQSKALAGVALLAAVMPLTYLNHLQESAPLLLLTFMLGVWALREERPVTYSVALAVGALNNETILALPALYFLNDLTSWRPSPLLRTFGRTILTAAPALAILGGIRYITRDRPDLASTWHLETNLSGIWTDLLQGPIDYWRAVYVYPLALFGALWILAFMDLKNMPRFLRRAALFVPLFVIVHLLAGNIAEARLMLPMAFLIIPMAFFSLFRERTR
jgi:hypothetical protein